MIDISVQILRLGGPHWYPKVRIIWNTDYENKMIFKMYRGIIKDDLSLVHTVVGTTGIKDYSFDDTREPDVVDGSNIKLGNRFRNYFYRIDSYLPNGSKRESSNTVSWNNSMYTTYEIEIMRGHEYYFTKLAGSAFFLFKRKVLDRQHCPFHWNKSTNRPDRFDIADVCEFCLNTGILNPYLSPVEAWFRILSPENSDQQADKVAKKRSFERLSLDCNGIPRIDPGDVILDNIDRTFYHVDKVSRVGKRHSEVRQNIQAAEMVQEKPEYKWLEVTASANSAMIDELFSQQKERRF